MIGLLRSVRRRLIESESTRRYLLYAAGEVVPYDALKATGLDKVSNDRVRAALIETYDYRLPRTADFVAMSSAQFVGVDPLQDALFRPALENGPDRLPRITSILNADAGLLDATIPVLVDARLSAARSARTRIEPLRDTADQLLALLEEELRLPRAARVGEDMNP